MHTLLAAEFLVRGAVQHDETGVLVAFGDGRGVERQYGVARL